jgi:NaMN:DMB phosphoribosyltransferase
VLLARVVRAVAEGVVTFGAERAATDATGLLGAFGDRGSAALAGLHEGILP